MAHCYWHEALEGSAPGDVVTLAGEEAHHAAVVSRMRRGERVLVSDGRGVLAEGVIDRADRDGVDVVLQHVQAVPPPSPRIGLAQALAKGDRAELAVQASTELGIDAIVPWQARRSVVQWKGDRAEKSLERWRKVVREAGKQAIRPHLPHVREVVDAAGLAALAAQWQLLVLEPTASLTIAEVAVERDVLLVVGPEGGIDAAELEALDAAGAVQVRMGDHVLRTSTAGPAGIAALSVRLGRW
ncbi:16S rRNA (uracil(1498)-N(3))-methyltransferase [Agrococcus sp. 1P02AA]|uniref:16S rRNA (uracil(1498)-N(3))-methyltransferase n=1 Tax=Agrococcus sp. 1P02AA TaxID=3132259 RepID=UPI0039A6AA42